jgi:hypothetical protein
MEEINKKQFSVTEILLSMIIKAAVLFGVYYLCDYFNFSIGLTGATILFLGSLYISIKYFKSFNKPKRVGFLGLTVSAFILSILFAYKHFVSDISITIIHVGILLCAPIILMNYLERKEKAKK